MFEKINVCLLIFGLMLLSVGVNLFLDKLSEAYTVNDRRQSSDEKTLKRYAEGYKNIPSIFRTHTNKPEYNFEYLLKEGTPSEVDFDSMVLNVDNLVLVKSGRYNFRRREKMREKLYEATKLIGSADFRFILGLAETSESDYVSEGKVPTKT